MKTFLISLTVYLVLIHPLTVDLVFPLENTKLEVVSNLDLKKFQGTWYEIAHNPWFPEKDCFSMIAHYKLTENHSMT